MSERRKGNGGPCRRRNRIARVSSESVTWEALHEIAAAHLGPADDLVIEITSDDQGLAVHIYAVAHCGVGAAANRNADTPSAS